MNWPMKPLGTIAKVIPGFAFKSKDLGEKGIPVIKIGSILDSRDVVPDTTQCFPQFLFEEKHKKFKLHNGNILLAMTGATAGKAGRVHCKDNEYFLLNQRVAKIAPQKINPDFLWIIISSDKYRSIFYGLGGGAAQPNMSGAQIESVEIPYPEISTQRRIASTLSAYDDLIENNRRRIQLLEESARLLYKEWFVRLRFPGHEHVKVEDGVPEGWEKLAVPDVISIKPKEKAEKGKKIKYIPMSCLSETGMTISRSGIEVREKSTSVKFRNGDVLFARITPCLENGKTGFVDMLADGELACGSTEFIVLRGNNVSYYYTYCLSRTYDFRENAIKSMIGSSGRQRVQESCFDDYMVLVPPKHIQSFFDENVGTIFLQIKKLSDQNYALAQARDLLLPRLMNGEVSV